MFRHIPEEPLFTKKGLDSYTRNDTDGHFLDEKHVSYRLLGAKGACCPIGWDHVSLYYCCELVTFRHGAICDCTSWLRLADSLPPRCTGINGSWMTCILGCCTKALSKAVEIVLESTSKVPDIEDD